MDGGETVLEQVPDQVVYQRNKGLLAYFQSAPDPAEGNGREDANGLGSV